VSRSKLERCLKTTLAFSLLWCAVTKADTLNGSIDKGRYLASAGDCVACHTAVRGKPFAGGLPLETPIGTIYSTNITPDPDTGIGAYTYEDFVKAVQGGVAKDGHALYPAMPYVSYARVTDDDMRSLYDYFTRGVPPVRQTNRKDDVAWPLNVRWPLHLWRLLFVRAPLKTRPTSTQANDKQLARGAYLVEGLGHCGACHTPRAITMQEKALSFSDGSSFLSGGALLGGWQAPSLQGDISDGLGNWSQQEVAQFLLTGRTARTDAFGSMEEVIYNSTQYLTADDASAIAQYLKAIPRTPSPGYAVPQTSARTSFDTLGNLRINSNGARVYVDNCMACHRSNGQGYSVAFPALAGNAALNGDTTEPIIRLVLAGSMSRGTRLTPASFYMPSFGWRLSNADVADVVNFIRQKPADTSFEATEETVAKIRSRLDTQTPK